MRRTPDAGRAIRSRPPSRRCRSASTPSTAPPGRPSAACRASSFATQRAQHAERDRGDRDEPDQRAREIAPAAVRADQRDDEREHDPREHIGDRGRRERELADRRCASCARSLRMRAMTGNAVIAIDAAMNSANGQNATPAGAKRACSAGAIANPSSIGSSDAERADPAALQRAARARPGARSSAPTTNMNSTRPIWLKPSSAGDLVARKQPRVRLAARARRTRSGRARCRRSFRRSPAAGRAGRPDREHARGREDERELQQEMRTWTS